MCSKEFFGRLFGVDAGAIEYEVRETSCDGSCVRETITREVGFGGRKVERTSGKRSHLLEQGLSQ